VLGKDGKDSLALKFLILYLGTYGVEAYPPAVQELATSAVLKAVKSPVSSFSDRNALLEVRALTDIEYSDPGTELLAANQSLTNISLSLCRRRALPIGKLLALWENSWSCLK
jgi:hypothetical protein